ncbi:ABC transporter ATP-binding protein [Nonomuraea roseoviolacea]|uniref:ABC transport system ATP-binding protein n=1 Tax=Nonomuraea roseoviolacea subsp. carminata TaxID=160689 RepID=A0ABT1JXG8_9ACTN|nr:ABC transporter ATP-binding protein [Nonomuraea roseoviolacea]MCP2345936.1 putative ABC transport system ATP-binding protein [Nonomuraea roseoviolacea subsp. carminata]
MTNKTTHALELHDVTKRHGAGDTAVTALDRVSLSIPHGTFTAVMGPSGSGKSTLLHCAAGLDRPDSGSVVLDGYELTDADETALTRLRRERMGFVFQSFNLVPTLTVAQNVALPLEFAGRRVDEREVRGLLSRLGLGDRLDHRPAELSGGQQQRVAIARAMLSRPAVVFADEPTGALDTQAARDVLHILREAVDASGQTIVMVTHDPVAGAYADAVVFFSDGRIVDSMTRPDPASVAARMARLSAPVRPSGHAPPSAVRPSGHVPSSAVRQSGQAPSSSVRTSGHAPSAPAPQNGRARHGGDGR